MEVIASIESMVIVVKIFVIKEKGDIVIVNYHNL